MPKGGLRITEQAIERLISEGRGQGELETYLPWLTVRDVPSRALQERPKGWKTFRPHHLFSPLELKVLVWLQWKGRVVDIREQFPLQPWRETFALTQRLGFKHPTDWKTKHAIVMTTDFVVTFRGPNGIEYLAIAVKRSIDLKDRRTVEKLLIERAYWNARGIQWIVMTERELDKILMKNLFWVRHHYFVEALSMDQSTVDFVSYEMTRRVVRCSLPLDDIAQQCDHDLDLPPGMSMPVAQHLIANKVWQVDMTARIGLDRPVILLNAEHLG